MTRADADVALAKRITEALPDIASSVNWLADGTYSHRTLRAAVALLQEAAGRLTLRVQP